MLGWLKKTPQKLQQKHNQEDYGVYRPWLTIICPKEVISEGPAIHCWGIPIFTLERNGDYFRVSHGWTVTTGKYVKPLPGETQINMLDFVFSQLPDKVGKAYYKQQALEKKLSEVEEEFEEEYARLVNTYTNNPE